MHLKSILVTTLVPELGKILLGNINTTALIQIHTQASSVKDFTNTEIINYCFITDIHSV
jgi:hypothetical protein